jgi:hypothetical protein
MRETHVNPRKERSRGMTMVLALFVTFLLTTLSLAFVTIMMEDSSGSRQSALQIMAAEGAEWGVETSLSYMGRGGNWQAAFDPDRLVFFDLLNAAQPNGADHLTAVSGGGGQIRIEIDPVDDSDTSLRTLHIVDPSLPGKATMRLDDKTIARVTVEVRPVVVPLAAYGPGQAPQYLLTSRCEVLREDSTSGDPVAVSQLEAQVRPEVETTALFQVQNLRSWDVQGGGIGNPNTADKILIPSFYKSAGSVRVTGTDPTVPNAPWAGQAGNVRFQDPNSKDMVFQGQLSVSQLNNLDLAGNSVSGSDASNFPGGVVFGADYLPLPSTERFLSEDSDGNGVVGTGSPPGPGDVGGKGDEFGLLAAAAMDKSAPSTTHGDPVSGYYRVGKDLIEEAHRRHPRVPSLASGRPLAQQDYRPPIPEVEVKLKADGFIEVNVWETTFGDGGNTSTEGSLNTAAATQMGSSGGPLGEVFHVDQLKNGVLYIEGGQVIVHSELSSGNAAEFEGRIQIVAAEDAVRRGQVKSGSGTQTFANATASLYHPAAAEFLQWQDRRMQLSASDPNYLDPADFKAPPFTAAQLRQAAASGHVSSSVSDLGGVNDSKPYWVPPKASVESEGNLVVAGDVVKKDGTNSIIGLTAENFLFLNDRSIGKKKSDNELVIEAVLTSFEHSLQFDWDNSSHNRVMNSGQSTYSQAMSPGFDGRIVLQGSMLAPFSDVEGDGQGRGYPRQEFKHDSELARWSPPFQPRTLLSEYPNDQISIAWSVVSFKDKTSKGVHLPSDG